jgi:hypothetical protein
MPRLSALFGAALCFIVSVTAGPTWAQGQPAKGYIRPRDLYKDCPPGQRIEFVIGTTPVYVDPRWFLGEPTLAEHPAEVTGCPTRPLEASALYFHMPQGMAVTSGLRTDVLALQSPNRPAKPPENGSGRNKPWVEDGTTPYNVRFLPIVRNYRLHYPQPEEGVDPIVGIICGQNERKRLCDDSPAYVYKGLLVTYKLERNPIRFEHSRN